ncbi:MAG: hypothetical protein ACRCX1_03590, partial [Bacteroidales bacterium]
MRKLSQYFFIAVFSLLSVLSLKASDVALEVKSQCINDALNEKGVFLGTVNGELVFGIEDMLSPDSVQYTSHLYRLKGNGSEFNVVKGESLSTPLRDCGFVDTKSGLIIIGGKTPAGFSSEVFEIKGDEQNAILNLPSLPVELANPVAGVINDQLIVTGGVGENGLNNQAWKLNLRHKDSKWESISPLPFNNGSTTHSAVQNSGDEDLLYLFGDKILTYSLKKNVWTDRTDRSKSIINVSGQLP